MNTLFATVLTAALAAAPVFAQGATLHFGPLHFGPTIASLHHYAWENTKVGFTSTRIGVATARARGFLIALALSVGSPQAILAQAATRMTEAEAVAKLASAEGSERDAAMRFVSELGPDAGRELRMSMIQAARAELGRSARGEIALEYLFTVVTLRDARAVPLLVESLVYGPFVADALAGFGDLALPLILDLVSNPERTVSDGVDMGLVTLRYMVEDGTVGPDHLARVTVVVHERLTTSQDWLVVIMAMGTAVALGDPALLRIVERVAKDSVASRGILGSSAEPVVLRDVQTEAQRLLDGGVAYPRRRPQENDGLHPPPWGCLTPLQRDKGMGQAGSLPMEWTPPPGGIAMCHDGTERLVGHLREEASNGGGFAKSGFGGCGVAVGERPE